MKKFPIAEIFTSPQGEGLYAGTLMTFIRFAGCSVGKKMSREKKEEMLQKEFPLMHDNEIGFYRELPNGEKVSQDSDFRIIPDYVELCTTYDGREFLCDTDFRTKEVLTAEEIVDKIPKGVAHVCLTGGEPLNQPLAQFIDFLSDLGQMVHIETSGTVSFTEQYKNYSEDDSLSNGGWLWITVSPKMGLLSEMIGIADEIKLLVDDQFDVTKIPEDVLDHKLVWLSPINEEFSLNRKNQDKCIKLLYEHPNWRLACQMHKIWGVR